MGHPPNLSVFFIFVITGLVYHMRSPFTSARTAFSAKMGRIPKGSPFRGAGSAQPRLRGCRRFVSAVCLRRPYLFSRKRKDRGEKSAWGRVWCILPLNSGGYQCFGLAFHTGLTLRASWYAPPDTGVSNLQLVSVEYLPSIEGATELLMGATFLRGPCSGAIIRQRSTANSGWRSLCGDQSSISSNASSPFLASALTSPWRTKSMVTKLRATNSAA